MPKKAADKIRVPLNVLIAPVTKESITGIQNETSESQGEIVDRAVALLALGEEIAPRVRKKSRREQSAEERAKSDITAQAVGRKDVDYSDLGAAPSTHVADLGKPLLSEKLTQRDTPEPGRAPWRRPIREKGDQTR